MCKEGGSFRHPHPDPFCDGFWAELARRYGLTERESEVLRLLCRGFSNRDIAEKLLVAYPTLRCHVRAVYRKLDCADRVDLILSLLDSERKSRSLSSQGMIAS